MAYLISHFNIDGRLKQRCPGAMNADVKNAQVDSGAAFDRRRLVLVDPKTRPCTSGKHVRMLMMLTLDVACCGQTCGDKRPPGPSDLVPLAQESPAQLSHGGCGERSVCRASVR